MPTYLLDRAHPLGIHLELLWHLAWLYLVFCMEAKDSRQVGEEVSNTSLMDAPSQLSYHCFLRVLELPSLLVLLENSPLIKWLLLLFFAEKVTLFS